MAPWLKSLLVSITGLSGLITITLAFLDRQPGDPLDLFFIPKRARLANGLFLALWVFLFVSMLLARLRLLPDQAPDIAGIAAILGTSWLTIYFRLRRHFQPPASGTEKRERSP